jgi:hypothetical protein
VVRRHYIDRTEIAELTESSPKNHVIVWGCIGDRLELESMVQIVYANPTGWTYCTEANPAIRIRQCIIGIRIERVYRIRLATKLESDVYLSVARYDPYWAETLHGL